jgi:NRPS condensation-like uncharacterized protein
LTGHIVCVIGGTGIKKRACWMKVQINIRIGEELLKRLRHFSKNEGLTVTDVIIAGINMMVKNYRVEHDKSE